MLVRKWGALVVALLLTPVLAFAQNTGKIQGRVLDTGSGQGLPGASVAVLGTSLGSITDVDGNYFVIGVPVGRYDVQASFVGYQTETFSGVQVSSGYTQEVNFSLVEGVELGEVVVEYERPLIQKDAVGAPKIVTGEEIVNLPVRGAASVAKIQAGVVSREGDNTLNVRGGRGSEVSYYIDGVKVIGTTSIPQSAIQEQEMIIGNISARYGDAMSGIINITTKSGAKDFFGSVEAITSESLDDFGYNLVSGTIGGPIGSDNLNFFLAGEFTDVADGNPNAVGTFALDGNTLNDLRGAPQGLPAIDANGNSILLPVPSGLTNGATLPVNDDGYLDVQGGTITASDGTVINVPEGVDPASIAFTPEARAEQIPSTQFQRVSKRPGDESQNLNVTGNVTVNPFESARLRLGGRINRFQGDNLSTDDWIFSPEDITQSDVNTYQIFGTWTQYLSNSTFYQLQVDYTNQFAETFDPRFGPDPSDWLNYGDFDAAPWATLRGYKDDPTLIEEVRTDDHGTPGDPSDDTQFTVLVPQYFYSYGDSDDPPFSAAANLVNAVGGRYNTYGKNKNTQWRFTAQATTQVGLNQIEFGAEYEQRTARAWGITADRLAGLVNDGNPEDIDPSDPDTDPAGYSAYGDIPTFIIAGIAGGFGYDIRGENEVDGENIDAFVTEDKFKDASSYNEAPYQPIYYGAYVQDKIEFRDIVLNIGLRVDVYDNNTLVLKDLYARRPIMRAGDVGNTPANVGADAAVYFNGDDLVGYRSAGTPNFFDADGSPVQAAEILLVGKPQLTNNQINASMFEDYEPQVSVMPRIGVSFPVTDRALFFARYGIVSQRPSSNSFADLGALSGTGGINNNNLEPEQTTEYEVGFRQRVTDRAAFTVSGFFRQIDNLIQLTSLQEAFPNEYSTYTNVDFGTVKGMEFGFDLRRTNGIALNANYTLAFADGTGSSSTTTGTIVWIDETPPNFVSPLDFDQRHKINLSFDYRLGAGEGPTVGGANILQNFGVNILATAGSGLPYTGISDPFPVTASRAANPTGGINEDRQPWTNRIDLRLDRKFGLGAGETSLTAFVWVQNLLDRDNARNVWRATGLPDDDGFLSTPDGAQFLSNNPPATLALYQFRNQHGRSLSSSGRDTGAMFGIPRLTRVGVRLDF